MTDQKDKDSKLARSILMVDIITILNIYDESNE